MTNQANTRASAPLRRPTRRWPWRRRSRRPAAGDQQGGHGPVDQARPGVARGRGEAEGGDGDQRGAGRLRQCHAGRQHQAGHDQEAAADAEEARQHADAGARPASRGSRCRRRLARQPRRRHARSRLGPQHQHADHDHERGRTRPGASDRRSSCQGGARQRAGDARGAEHDGAGPADVPARACRPRLAAAFAATATAPVPMATCGEDTPTA